MFSEIRLGVLVALMVTSHLTWADEHSHAYHEGEEVVLWMNTVGPYHNRQETYSFFSLPYCKGPQQEIGHYHETMAEALQGVELEFSGLEISFKDPKLKKEYCSVDLTDAKFKAFVYAIENHYWYQMYIDDLPIWGIVGEVEDGQDGKEYFLWTHRRLDIGWNGNQIVDVNLTSEGKTRIEVGMTLPFTYQVNWRQSRIPFSHRFDKYLDPNFFQHRIHWFSIFNSFMMVIFLVGLVSMIMMRTLRKDYARYSRDDDLDDLERDIGDEYGWKQVHGDVFRPPVYPIVFTSLVGCGHQLAVVAIGCITSELMGHLYTQRGTLLSTAIFLYAVTSPVNGYFGAALYSRFGGKEWIKQVLVGAALFPATVSGTAFLMNLIAIYYHASRAIPFLTMLQFGTYLPTFRLDALAILTMVSVACICLFVILPLTMVGAILGRNISGQPDNPCRINTVPRPIPEKKWFMEPWAIVLLGGVLPFGSIFIEVYFIFTSFWQYKIYYVFGFMMLVFVIMIVVTVCVTIVCTYFLLNSEDYRWQWTSFCAGGSISIYVYLYSFYYFLFKTKMYGLFQTMFFFSYMGVGSVALGILCGTVGFIGTNYFVRKIYSTVKID